MQQGADPQVYGPLVIEHATNPRNVGTLEAASGVGSAGNPVVGNTVRISVRVDDGQVVAARFRAFGCSATIAAASIATELAVGRSAAQARLLDARAIERALGGLPAEKRHCATVAAGALQQALDGSG